MDSFVAVTPAFTKALPKIELHAHLSGSISRECLREIWLRKREHDPKLQVPDPMIAMPPGKVDYSLKTDLESIRYSTKRVLQDFQGDGVKYLELRTTPREIQEQGVSKELYVSTVLDVIDDFKNEAMSTYLILSIDRTKSAAEAEILVDLAIKFKDRGVVGVELGGNPSKGDVSIFKGAFSKAKQNGLGVTLHFAEVEFSSSPKELTTLLSFQPDRLGHVINVPDDIKEEISRRKIGLELCLSCNVHAKLITGDYPDHHFGYWRHKDCPIILCTDDVGFFCSPVSDEYLLAATNFNLDQSALLNICRKGVDSIFGGPREKERLYSLIDKFEDGLQ